MKDLINYIKSVKLPHVNDIERLYLSKEVKEVLKNYKFTLLELIYRIKRNIPLDKVFVCKNCGNVVGFKHYKYFDFCCHKCALTYIHKSDNRNVKISNSHKQKFIEAKNTVNDILKKYNLTFEEYTYRINRDIPLDRKFICKNCGNEIKFKYHRYEDFCNYKCANNYLPSIKKRNENIYNTKKINNTFNISKPEKEIEILLKQNFDNIKTQYRSREYPFNCDFYIPSLNLYIEFNGHWSHGWDHNKCLGIFNKNNKEHLELLNKWKQRNTKYYKNAVKVWTVKDPLKVETAKRNKINYKIFWTIGEFKLWLERIIGG